MHRAIARSWLSSVALELVVVAVLAIGALWAGSPLFVCDHVGATSAMPCCAQSHASAHAMGDAMAAIDRAPCCAHDDVGSLPPGMTTVANTSGSVPDAPLVATIPPAMSTADALPVRMLDRSRMLARAGPPPKDTGPSRLMVFLL